MVSECSFRTTGIADLLRRLHRLFFGDGDSRLHRRDSIRRQQLLRLVLRQQCAALLARLAENPRRLAALQLGVSVLRQRRRFVQPLQVVGIPPHVIEGPHRAVGELERRNAGLVQDLLARGDFRAAHPARQHRLAEALGVRLQLLGDLRRIRHVLRRQDHQHAVDGRVLRRDFQRLRIALRFGVAQGCRSDCCGSTAPAGFRRTPPSSPATSSASSPPPATSASVASTPGPPALVRMASRLPRGRGCFASTSDMKKMSAMLFTRSTPLRRNAASSTSSLPVSEPGMRSRSLGRLRRASGLDHDDRLVERNFACRRQERAGVADRFHVNHDAVRPRIAAEVVDQVAPAHVQHRTGRDERAEAHVLAQAPVENRRQQARRSG